MIIGGDIGGTKTDLAVFETESGRPVPGPVLTYASQDYDHLGGILESFLSQVEAAGATICLGMPGPVREGVCKTTNLPWIVDAAELAALEGVDRVVLLNDLEAAGHGLPLLGPDDLVELNPRARESLGNRILVSAGTGLGEGILFWDGATWRPSASEGSHADFAARDELEWDLARELGQEVGHLSYDYLVSGPGLIRLYRFLSGREPDRADPATARQIEEGQGAAVIAQAALEEICPVCGQALDWLISLYGSEAGNLALKALSRGGVYLGGGIAPKILPALRKGGFMKAFLNKGRMAEVLDRMPVRVVLEPRTSLLGAGYVAWQQARN